MSKDVYGHRCQNFGSVWNLKGRSFDGVDDYVQVPDHPTLDISSIWTIEFRIKFNAATNGTVITKSTGIESNSHGIRIQSNGVLFVTEGATDRLSSDYSAYLGQWLHVTAKSSDIGSELFFNGNRIATGTQFAIFFNNVANLRIGNAAYAFWGSGSAPFNGLIDEVRILNRAEYDAKILQRALISRRN